MESQRRQQPGWQRPWQQLEATARAKKAGSTGGDKETAQGQRETDRTQQSAAAWTGGKQAQERERAGSIVQGECGNELDIRFAADQHQLLRGGPGAGIITQGGGGNKTESIPVQRTV